MDEHYDECPYTLDYLKQFLIENQQKLSKKLFKQTLEIIKHKEKKITEYELYINFLSIILNKIKSYKKLKNNSAIIHYLNNIKVINELKKIIENNKNINIVKVRDYEINNIQDVKKYKSYGILQKIIDNGFGRLLVDFLQDDRINDKTKLLIKNYIKNMYLSQKSPYDEALIELIKEDILIRGKIPTEDEINKFIMTPTLMLGITENENNIRRLQRRINERKYYNFAYSLVSKRIKSTDPSVVKITRHRLNDEIREFLKERGEDVLTINDNRVFSIYNDLELFNEFIGKYTTPNELHELRLLFMAHKLKNKEEKEEEKEEEKGEEEEKEEDDELSIDNYNDDYDNFD